MDLGVSGLPAWGGQKVGVGEGRLQGHSFCRCVSAKGHFRHAVESGGVASGQLRVRELISLQAVEQSGVTDCKQAERVEWSLWALSFLSQRESSYLFFSFASSEGKPVLPPPRPGQFSSFWLRGRQPRVKDRFRDK